MRVTQIQYFTHSFIHIAAPPGMLNENCQRSRSRAADINIFARCAHVNNP